MKKILLVIASIMMMADIASAQNLLKYNYKKNNLIYTGAERIRVEAPTSKDIPVHIKLSRVLFTDGQPVYILRLDFEDVSAWKMPANAPLTIATSNGRSILLKNSANAPNLVAPNGFKNNEGKTVYLNYGEYYLEEADMQKLISGVASIDATKRWSSDGTIKISYKNNEFGSALAKQYNAIKSTAKPSAELGSNLKSLSDQRGSRLVETNTIKVNDQLSISLVYLYYASSNSESIDLNLYLSGRTIPFNSQIKVITKLGGTINLKQEKELAAGRAICYPSLDELKLMTEGVARIIVQTTGQEVSINFNSDEFGKAIEKLYNSLMTVSIL